MNPKRGNIGNPNLLQGGPCSVPLWFLQGSGILPWYCQCCKIERCAARRQRSPSLLLRATLQVVPNLSHTVFVIQEFPGIHNSMSFTHLFPSRGCGKDGPPSQVDFMRQFATYYFWRGPNHTNQQWRKCRTPLKLWPYHDLTYRYVKKYHTLGHTWSFFLGSSIGASKKYGQKKSNNSWLKGSMSWFKENLTIPIDHKGA